MADYIDKNILCQAYIHVHLDDRLSAAQLSEIRSHLEQYASSRGKFFISPEVVAEVEFKEGSLKSYLTLAGALYIAIGQYGSFRSGVDCLYTDTKRLSDALVAESLFSTQSRFQQVIRTEARVGVIGSLKAVVDDMESIETLQGQVSVSEIARRINKLKADSQTLSDNLRDPKDVAELQKELDSFADARPEECPFPPKRKPPQYAIIEYAEALENFRKSFGKKKNKKP